MNTRTKLLHDMRGQQLRAICKLGICTFTPMEYDSLVRYQNLCGAQYDTRNLSDKALEEIDTLAGKYLERA